MLFGLYFWLIRVVHYVYIDFLGWSKPSAFTSSLIFVQHSAPFVLYNILLHTIINREKRMLFFFNQSDIFFTDLFYTSQQKKKIQCSAFSYILKLDIRYQDIQKAKLASMHIYSVLFYDTLVFTLVNRYLVVYRYFCWLVYIWKLETDSRLS